MNQAELCIYSVHVNFRLGSKIPKTHGAANSQGAYICGIVVLTVMSSQAVKRAAAAGIDVEAAAASASHDADAAAPAAAEEQSRTYWTVFKPVIMLVVFVVVVLAAVISDDSNVLSGALSTGFQASSSTAALEFEESSGMPNDGTWSPPHSNWPLSPLSAHKVIQKDTEGTISVVHSRVPPTREISSGRVPSRLLNTNVERGVPQHHTPTQGVALLFHGCKNSESTWVTGPEEQRFVLALHAAGWWVLAIASAAADAAHQRGGPKGGGCWDSHSFPNAQVNADVKRTLLAVDDVLTRFPALQQLPWVTLGVSSGGAFAAHVSHTVMQRVSLVGLVPVVSGLPKRILEVVGDPAVPRSDWPIPKHTLFVPMQNDARSQAAITRQVAALNKKQPEGKSPAGRSYPGPETSPAAPAEVHIAPSFPFSLQTLHAHLPALPLPATAHMMGCLQRIGEATHRNALPPAQRKMLPVLDTAMQAADNFLQGFVKNYNPRQWLKPKTMRFILPAEGRGQAMPAAAAAYYAAMAPLVAELWQGRITLDLRDEGRSEGPMSCAVAAVDAALMLAAAESWQLPAEARVPRTAASSGNWPEGGLTVQQANHLEIQAREAALGWVSSEALDTMMQVHRQLHAEMKDPPLAKGQRGTNKHTLKDEHVLLLGSPVGVRLPGVPLTRGFANSTLPAGGLTPVQGGGLRGGADPSHDNVKQKAPYGPLSLRHVRETILAGVQEVMNAAFARHDMTSSNVQEVLAWMQRVKAAKV